MNTKLWKQFQSYGSGWELTAERNHSKDGKPLFFRLRMYGMVYPRNYKIDGLTIEEVLTHAMEDGDRFLEEWRKKEINPKYDFKS